MSKKRFILTTVLVIIIAAALGALLSLYFITEHYTHSSATIPGGDENRTILRWNHFPLTVYIDDSFIPTSPEYVECVRDALDQWEQTIDFIVFEEVTQSEDHDILVEWVPTLRVGAKDAAGDAETTFLDVGEFGVIQEAEIHLLTKLRKRSLSTTDMTNIALHEIGHAIGLEHLANEDAVMHETLLIPSRHVKDITAEEIAIVEALYEDEPLPDFIFTGSVNGSKYAISNPLITRYYANASFTIKNAGLVPASDVDFILKADGEEILHDSILRLRIGEILTISLANVLAPGDFTTLEIVLDEGNSIRELNETNNMIQLVVE